MNSETPLGPDEDDMSDGSSHWDPDAVSAWSEIENKSFRTNDDAEALRNFDHRETSRASGSPVHDPFLLMQYDTIRLATHRRRRWVSRRRWTLAAIGSAAIFIGSVWFLTGEPFFGEPVERGRQDVSPFWFFFVGSTSLIGSRFSGTIGYAGEKFGGSSYYRMRDRYNDR